ncbi:MAG: TolC family protein [Campylobacterales bacterium]|nr:TolC family protein [Campylobacterales bacterium]
MRLLLCLSLSASVLLASESLLSSLKQEQLRLEREQNELNSDILKYQWLNPIEGAWNWTKTEDSLSSDRETGTFSVSLNQPIFKSGGIYFAMRYADANRAFLRLSTQLETQTLIKQAMGLVLRHQKTVLQKERTRFQIDNARIDIVRKTEQFESGFADSSDLDQALLAKNTLQHTLLELERTEMEIAKEFESISDASLKELTLPVFEMVDEATYLASSLHVKQQAGAYERSKWLQRANVSTFLPTISLNAAYYNAKQYDDRSERDEYQTYGIRISMPLYDINRARSLELKRVETLQENVKLQDVKRSETKLFERVYDEVRFLNQKRAISLESFALYGQLLGSATELAEAGEKTIHDVQTLENSRETMRLDAQIYALDAQLSLLDLYAKMQGEI